MKYYIFYFSLLLILFSSSIVKSQKSVRDSSITIPSISINYGYHFGFGDIGNTYGNNHAIGSDFTLKLKSQFILGFGGEYYFSENVKNQDSYFTNIKTDNGNIIDNGGLYSEIFLYQRGFNIQVFTGYQFSKWSPNVNSGPFIQVGAGIMQYRTQIHDQNNSAPQVKDEYRKLYDRLSNGFSVTQLLGYRHMGNNNIANFYLGIELTEAWTKNRRSYNADLDPNENLQHFDFLIGLKLGWMIPFYKRAPQEYYY